MDSGDVFPEPSLTGGKPTYRGGPLHKAAAISAAAHVGQVSAVRAEDMHVVTWRFYVNSLIQFKSPALLSLSHHFRECM